MSALSKTAQQADGVDRPHCTHHQPAALTAAAHRPAVEPLELKRMEFPQLNSIRDKLLKLREMDTGLSFFGADEHRYGLNPPVPESVVAAFEGKYGVTLPAQYREFLLSAGDGGAGPYYGLYPLRYAYDTARRSVLPLRLR